VLPSGADLRDTDWNTLADQESGERWLLEDYCAMLAVAGPVFGRLFALLAEADAGPSLLHCAAGKDRTGMAAALLLTCLGVDRELVLDDYELTTAYCPADRWRTVLELFVDGGVAPGRPRRDCSAPLDG
jgi:protein-tyrosine phosphatase